jgi:hypothetical protein
MPAPNQPEARHPKSDRESHRYGWLPPNHVVFVTGAFVRPGFRDSDFELLSAFGFRPSILDALPNLLAGWSGGFQVEIKN